MKFITYINENSQRLGAFLEQDKFILDLNSASDIMDIAGDCFSDMLSFIESGKRGLDLAKLLIDAKPDMAIVKSSDIKLLPPLTRPVTIRSCGLFIQHLESAAHHMSELENKESSNSPENKTALMKITKVLQLVRNRVGYMSYSPKYVSGPDDDIHIPIYSQWLDFELEIAAIIGKEGKDISKNNAAEYIFGYTIFNDWSARDEQKIWMDVGLNPGKGKEFDCSKGIGPCIVAPDEIGDPYNLQMVARVNGEEWGRGSTKDMHHQFEDAIADFSRSETLLPGEVVGSGTITGGSGIDQGRRLKEGDIVELEIENIGILRNKVVA